MKDKKYSIAFSREANIPQGATIGEITDENKSFLCELVLNDTFIKQYERKDLILSLLPLKLPAIPHYKIIVSADFLKQLQKQNSDAFFKLYHELGHIHNKDLLTPENPENEALRKQGIPTAEDLAADKFAKSYMGLKNSVNALKAVRREREALCKEVSCGERGEINRAALKEIAPRIEALKQQ